LRRRDRLTLAAAIVSNGLAGKLTAEGLMLNGDDLASFGMDVALDLDRRAAAECDEKVDDDVPDSRSWEVRGELAERERWLRTVQDLRAAHGVAGYASAVLAIDELLARMEPE